MEVGGSRSYVSVLVYCFVFLGGYGFLLSICFGVFRRFFSGVTGILW